MSTDYGPVDDPIPTKVRQRCPPVCVQCEYLLYGLSADARCPECGAEIDLSVITIDGWSANSLPTMRPRTLILIGGALVLYLLLFISDTGVIHRGFDIMSSPLFAMILAGLLVVAGIAIRFWFSSGPASVPVRLRLSPKGFEQRTGPGPLKLTPWRPTMLVSALDERKGRQSLYVAWSGSRFLPRIRQYPIAFEFNADAAMAKQLQVLVENWIRYGPLLDNV
jgi:hypothetical protein